MWIQVDADTVDKMLCSELIDSDIEVSSKNFNIYGRSLGPNIEILWSLTPYEPQSLAGT